MWLDKGQVCPSDLSLDPSDDWFDRSVPYARPCNLGFGVSRFHALDVDRVVDDSCLSTVNQGIDVWFEEFRVIDIGRVA